MKRWDRDDWINFGFAASLTIFSLAAIIMLFLGYVAPFLVDQ